MKQTALLNAMLAVDAEVDAARDVATYYTVYDEYLRGFDELPVLQDAVRIPPRRLEPDFRLGERRDARKEPRPDAYIVREEYRAALERLYAEYCAPPPAAKSRRKRAAKRRPRKAK